MGLATGPAAVGHVGTEDQRSFAAIGDTTNLAARLQSEARPGEALVAGSTASRASRPETLTARGRIAVKGRSEEVDVFALDVGPPEPGTDAA